MDIYCEQTITKKETKPLEFISSLGFVMPFQPSMWDDKSIQSALDYGTHIIEKTLQNTYSAECIKTMLGRLQLLFKRLNFNTHRKGLAIIISADSEKVFYLNYPVRFSVCTGDFISLLGLVQSIEQETGFYLHFTCQENICLYEYNNKLLNKVYEQKPDGVSGYFAEADVRVSSVITYMNSNYQKPVFIVGSKEEVNSFQKAVCYHKIIFKKIKPQVKYSAETVLAVVTEIVGQWGYWLSKFHTGRIALAKKNNCLAFHYEEVLKALCNSADGLMLMDKRVKKQLQKPATDDTHFQGSTIFINQVEKFVERGNCIVIKENGLLRDWGGIVLLPDTMPGHRDQHAFGGYRIAGGTSNIF